MLRQDTSILRLDLKFIPPETLRTLSAIACVHRGKDVFVGFQFNRAGYKAPDCLLHIVTDLSSKPLIINRVICPNILLDLQHMDRSDEVLTRNRFWSPWVLFSRPRTQTQRGRHILE